MFLGEFMGRLVAKYFGYQGTFFSLMVTMWLILVASIYSAEKKEKLIKTIGLNN